MGVAERPITWPPNSRFCLSITGKQTVNEGTLVNWDKVEHVGGSLVAENADGKFWVSCALATELIPQLLLEC